MDKALELKNISFKYEKDLPLILLNSNLELFYGEIAILYGDSGSGKSTIFSLINGIIPNINKGMIKGEILYKNKNIKDETILDRSKYIGSVLQNPESQTIYDIVKDEISFSLENICCEENKFDFIINHLTEEFNLDKNQKIETLSGGQKQKLVTLCTLAMGQKILIFDEPLANLDKKTSIKFLNHLNNLKQKGYCIFIIEHRIDYLLKYADKIYKLENKKIIEKQKNEVLFSKEIIKRNVTNNIIDNKKQFNLKDIDFYVKRNGKKQYILKKINFSINEGERFLILGDNGNGKSTLLKIIARLLKQKKGIIEQNINKKFKSKKTGGRDWFLNVGYVFQNPNYQLFMKTVKEEIMISSQDDNFSNYLIDKLKLREFLDRHPQSLSEGQKRRLTLAAILAQKPKVLILDEPTVGQDLENLKNMMELLEEINKNEKITIISITHDIRCSYVLCDKCMILEENKYIIGNKDLIEDYFSREYDNKKNCSF